MTVQDKTDFQRFIATVVFQPANTFGQRDEFRPPEYFFDLHRGENLMGLWQGLINRDNSR
jgi:hypothetical protein